MKASLFTLAFLSQLLVADEIDVLINKIKEDRKSKVSKSELINLKSPLVRLETKSEVKDDNKTKKLKVNMFKEEASFNLTAIINKRAHVNNKWVKIGDTIESYKVVDIMEDSVFLKDGNKTRLVTFRTEINKIKIIGR